MSLYTIDREIQALIDSIYDSVDENGEVAVDLTALAELKAERQTKCENIALYIKNCDAEAAAIQVEIENLEKRKARLERKSEGLRGILISSMIANKDTELSSPRYRATIKTSETTEIVDKKLIPKEFIRVTIPEPKEDPDKVAIKKAIKAGREIAGARLVTNRKVNIE